MPDPESHESETVDLQIAEILDCYRQELHDGDDPDPEACLDAHPDLAADLADCLQGLAAMEELRQALHAASPPAPAPRSLGDFQLVREVGRGGMGVVHEAIHTRLNRRVALKMIKAGALAGGEELELFRKEALAAASLHHPNIVQLFELGDDAGQPYLVLEFVDGGGLDAKLAGTPLDPIEAAQLLATLARAMHYAHERGIVHRDLKPANVLLKNAEPGSQPGSQQDALHQHFKLQGAVPKINDFGLAKHLHTDPAETQSGAIKGTPSYMSPEQARGGEIGAASDVYALGAVLYETLTGRPPFRAATPLDTLMQVTTLEPVPPRRLQPLVPLDLETICLKCLQKEPHRRYASAQDLADELGRFLRHEPIHARPVGVVGRVARWCRRNKLVASLLGVAAALTALVLVLIVSRLLDERAERDRILADNVFAANHLANTILVELWKMAETVDQTANDPELRRLLKEDRARLQPLPPRDDPARPRFALPEDQRRLQPYLEKLHAQGKFVFHSWHVEDKDGILLADAPRPIREVFGVDFRGRDYFVGAMRHAGTIGRARVHVSRAYQSANDRLFKITLSAAIYDDAERRAPVGVFCATLPTDANFGFLDLTDAEHTTVLVGRVDTNDPHRDPPGEDSPERFMLLVHPAYGDLPEYGQGKKAALMPQAMLPLVPRRRGDERDEFVPAPRSVVAAANARHEAYEDPLGAVHPSKYGGRWLAGFAQVGNTELVVIVQRRREEWSAAWFWVLLAAGALAVAGAIGTAWWRRRRHRAPPAPTVPPDQAPTVALTTPPVRHAE